MAHNGQHDRLEADDPEEQNPELSDRQEVKMMKGLIHMMKQQLKEIRESPSSMKEVRTPQEDFQVRREELYLPQAVQ
eukprot:10556010-Prorocentrum_lima.AAC.1